MKYNHLPTDDLCDIIVTEVGVPIPTYNYEYRKFVACFPQNIKVGDCTTGIEKADMFDSFREACLRIVEWHIESFPPKFTKVINYRGREWKQDAEVLDCIECGHRDGCNSWGCCSPACGITGECFGNKSIGTWCPFGEIPDDKKMFFK